MLALLFAVPVYADSDKSEGEGEHRGNVLARLFHDGEKGNSEHEQERKHESATSTVKVSGKVIVIAGSTLTVSGKDGATYTVDASSAVIASHDVSTTIADIHVGDSIEVKGTLDGSIIRAIRIKSSDFKERMMLGSLENLRLGIVTSISTGGFSLMGLGTGTTTVETNASTTILNKKSPNSTVEVGTRVLVKGTASTTPGGTFAADIIVILGKGFGWLKHVLGNS